MLEEEHLLSDEAGSPLILRTFEDFPRQHIPSAVRRVKSWVDLLPGAQVVIMDLSNASKCTDEEMLRVFEEDAKRTFIAKDNPEVQVRTKARQQRQVETLKLIQTDVLDYHQGMGSLVAFLQLFLPMEDVAKVVLTLHRSPKHSSGYFASEPQTFAGDAQVLRRLMAEREPELSAHLTKLGALPEGYASRWFIGLAVHVLPLRELLDYWEAFFQYGTEFVFSFGLEYVREFRSELMLEKATSGLMAILRLEDSHAEWKVPPQLRQGISERLSRIIERAVDALGNKALGEPHRLEQMRKEEVKEVSRRVEEARKRAQELEEEDDGIVFSDEED